MDGGAVGRSRWVDHAHRCGNRCQVNTRTSCRFANAWHSPWVYTSDPALYRMG